MSMEYLGIDIGGTAVKLGLVDAFGTILAQKEASVSFDHYRTPILSSVISAAESFLSSCGAKQITGIGVSATGQIDTRSGSVAGTCGSLPGWNGSPIRQKLEDRFGLPVTVANDANCMCLGEAWTGAAKGYCDVVCITIGTGLGGGILTGGRLLSGFRGLGGEIGHMRTHAVDGETCTCGAVGCWERYASTSALTRRAERINPDMRNGRIIFDAARSGDREMTHLIGLWTDEIAQGLIGLVHIFNPQLIVIGGGVSNEKELLIEPLAQRVRNGVMPAFAQQLEIRPAALKNSAGLVGAVRYFMTCHPA